MDEAVVFELLQTAVLLAPVAVFVAAQDLTTWLERAGYHHIELFRVRKSRGFTRYVHRAQAVSRPTPNSGS